MDSRLGLVVSSLGVSLAVFPGPRSFRGLLLGPVFLKASSLVNFLLPAGVEAESRVGGAILGLPMPSGGRAVARVPETLAEPR